MKAIKKGDVEELRTLILANADVNAPSRDSVPLIDAVRANKPACVQELIAAKADLEGHERAPCTALTEAIANGYNECAKLLIAAKADLDTFDVVMEGSPSPMVAAIEENNIEGMRMLIKAKANLEERNFEGVPFLSIAARNGRSECMRILIANNADVNVEDMSMEPYTPLLWAASEGHAPCVRVLLEAKATIDVDDGDMNALMEAAQNGKTECVRLILNGYRQSIGLPTGTHERRDNHCHRLSRC